MPGEIKFVLDTPEAVMVNYNTFLLTGWCFSRNKLDNIELELHVDDLAVPVYLGLDRPDVATAHGPEAATSGFVVRFNRPVGSASLSLKGRSNGVEFVIAQDIPFNLEAPDGLVTSYRDWLRLREVPNPSLVFKYKPLITVVLSGIASAYAAQRTLDSLKEQVYKNWSSSEAPSTEVVVYIERGDELHPHALLELVRAINTHPEASAFYSDEDRIDAVGIRSQPSFKPDFDENIFPSLESLGDMLAVKQGPATLTAIHIRRPLYHRRKAVAPLRTKHTPSTPIEIAVICPPQDGPFQESIIRMNGGRHTIHVYPSLEVAQTGKLFVFINGQLEALNHLFFEELAAQAMHADNGLITGISLDPLRRVIASGFVRTTEHGLIDPYLGSQFPNSGYLGQLNTPRHIDACPDIFYALRRELLGRTDLPVLFTPFAVATFSEGTTPSLFQEAPKSDSSKLNPNIFDFRDWNKLLLGIMKEEQAPAAAPVRPPVISPLRRMIKSIRGGS